MKFSQHHDKKYTQNTGNTSSCNEDIASASHANWKLPRVNETREGVLRFTLKSTGIAPTERDGDEVEKVCKIENCKIQGIYSSKVSARTLALHTYCTRIERL
jgi:hypothetical protein